MAKIATLIAVFAISTVMSTRLGRSINVHTRRRMRTEDRWNSCRERRLKLNNAVSEADTAPEQTNKIAKSSQIIVTSFYRITVGRIWLM